MLDQVFTIQNVSEKKRVSMKMLTALLTLVLAVTLPQLVHLALGQPGGIQYLPMYLPVLLGACLLGWRWGLVVGMLSPLASFLLTSALGNPMPLAVRLPFMMVELAIFAGVAGAFSKKIYENSLWSLPAVLAAQIIGRLSFLGLVAIFSSLVPFGPAIIWNQILSGVPGLVIQLIAVPLLVYVIGKLIRQDEK